MVGSLVGLLCFVLFCFICCFFAALSSIGGLEKSMYRKVWLSEAQIEGATRKKAVETCANCPDLCRKCLDQKL